VAEARHALNGVSAGCSGAKSTEATQLFSKNARSYLAIKKVMGQKTQIYLIYSLLPNSG
jgi:hypothetical protein